MSATLSWSDWQSYPSDGAHSPYVAWWMKTAEAPGVALSPAAATAPAAGTALDSGPAAGTAAQAFLAEFPQRRVPQRAGVANPDFWTDALAAPDPEDALKAWWPDMARKDVPALPPNAVIVGVVDRGVPLHHSRHRDADGTRILAAWQQDMPWESGQRYLPFGRELYKADIDAAIAQLGQPGTEDEDALNARFGLLERRGAQTPRAIAGRQSHGAAVLDLATGGIGAGGIGAAPVYTIVVNLPDREAVGLSGTFLDVFTTLALYRISALSDWLWKENSKRWRAEGLAPVTGQQGFPTVVNLSFGKNAGPRTGTGFFQNMLKALRESRPAGAPLTLVVPAGNDNLAEGNALLNLPADGGFHGIDWLMPPEDQTQNFVEMWSDPIPAAEAATVEIEVTAPGQAMGASVTPRLGQVRYLTAAGAPDDPLAAIYLRSFPEPHMQDYVRLQFVICARPTLDYDAPGATVPGGRWRIALRNHGSAQTAVALAVQTDQSPLPTGAIGRRSAFWDPHYATHDWADGAGRVQDSYAFPLPATPMRTDHAPRVLRHGTVNATASAPGTIITAGHRVSDGRPVPYSATGPLGGETWQSPTLSLPVEDSPADRGILTAGSMDGSVIPASGTSFAAAEATRRLALHYVTVLYEAADAAGVDGFDPVSWFGAQATATDQSPSLAIPRAKLGRGRVGYAEPDRQARGRWA